jgi:hypothetical protein
MAAERDQLVAAGLGGARMSGNNGFGNGGGDGVPGKSSKHDPAYRGIAK